MARAEIAAERRALDALDPRARLVSARELVGRLLDRATAAATGRVERVRLDRERLGSRLAPTLPGRLGAARATVAAGVAALSALGPQATLDRGYAIVRRADDDSVVRGPDEAAPGTRLRLRVARGELPATADER
jgi:exodeoxyribonuclease VII large subunit